MRKSLRALLPLFPPQPKLYDVGPTRGVNAPRRRPSPFAVSPKPLLTRVAVERCERFGAIRRSYRVHDDDQISGAIIGAAIHIHQRLGGGLLESAYDECLGYVLARSGLKVQRQLELPIVFEGHRLNSTYRVDLLVEKRLIVEVKSVERILPVHEAQLRTYLRLSGLDAGLLLNFCVPVMKDGIRRINL